MNQNLYEQHAEKTESLYENFKEFILLCPNFDNDYTLFDTDVHYFFKSFVFQISKCREELLEPGDLPCANETEIEEFVDRVFIESWASFLSVDF